jgi:MFS family permease
VGLLDHDGRPRGHPGPVIVALIAGPAGKLAAQIGFRPVLLFGGSCFAIGLATFAVRVTSTPDYAFTWLPGSLLVGVGVGFTFPVLSAAAVSTLPPARFAVGSAVNQTARQIGGALGIAVLVALIGSQRSLANPVDGFRQLWAFAATTALVSGIIGSFIPRPAAGGHPQPNTRPTTCSNRAHLRSRLTALDRSPLDQVVDSDTNQESRP